MQNEKKIIVIIFSSFCKIKKKTGSLEVDSSAIVGVKCSEDVLTEVVRIAAGDDDMLWSQWWSELMVTSTWWYVGHN